MRAIGAADSAPVATSAFRVYMLRVSTLISRGNGRYDLGWKQAPRNRVQRAEDGTPVFAEMAAPGTVFEGFWNEKAYLSQPELQRALRWRDPVTTARIFEAANQYAARLLEIHKQYAACAGMPALQQGVEQLESQLSRVQGSGNACLVCVGWGTGLLAKTGWLDTDSQTYRDALKAVSLYARALQTGLPFPKTRRILFLNNQPSALPGWALLQV